MKNLVFKVICYLICLTVFSCSKDDFPEFNKIESARVITLIADTPEVNPGAAVTITPVISDLQATTSPKDSVQVCIDTGIAFGAEPSCENNPSKSVLFSERILTLPGGSDNWTGLADSFVVNIPSSTILFNQRSLQDQYNGINFLVEYIFYPSNSKAIKSLKRIVVSTNLKIQKNTNPLVSNIYSEGLPFTNLPLGASVNLTTDINSTSLESYDQKLSDGTSRALQEDLTTTWFITDGKTKSARTVFQDSNLHTRPSESPIGRSSYIMAVVKDSRGGVGVVKKKLN